MPKFKNIRVKMKNGKSRLQRVQVLKSGKYKFVSNKSGSKKSTGSKKSGSTKKKKSYVTKTKNKGGRSMGSSAHIAATAGLVAYPLGVAVAAFTKRIKPWDAVGMLTAGYTGVNVMNGEWQFAPMILNYGSIGIGAGMSKLFSWLKINRMYPKGVNV